jgi:enamine deaminase RidA (YjgF/YER057c/UK114 family)
MDKDRTKRQQTFSARSTFQVDALPLGAEIEVEVVLQL